MRTTVWVWLSVLLVTGCSHTGSYRQQYVSLELAVIEASLDGKALVVTDPKADERVYAVHPSSLTGRTSVYRAKLGAFLRRITVSALQEKFREGADHSVIRPNESPYRMTIEPTIVDYDYRYNQLRNLGLWITPEAKITIRVSIYNESGHLVMQQQYESTYRSGGGYAVDFRPGEKINKATHQAIVEVVKRMIEDIEVAVSQAES
jgi:uncharacterized lipoprotein YajG